MGTRRQFISGFAAAALSSRLQGGATDPALVKAMDAVRAAIPAAEADPDRPAYHFRSPANLTNDPNGTIFYKEFPEVWPLKGARFSLERFHV